MTPRFARSMLLALVAFAAPATHAAVTVTEPNGVGDPRVPAGREFATEVLANPWDMDDAADIATLESGGLTNQTFSGGRFSATTTNNDPGFYLLFQGIGGTVPMTRGALNPIDTSVYRYLTIRMRLNSADPSLKQMQVFYFKDGVNASQGIFGSTPGIEFPRNQWHIVTIDLVTQQEPTAPHGWTTHPRMGGLRIDPIGEPGATVELDWARLTAESPASTFNVTWTDTQSGSYTVSALDAAGTAFVLGSGIGGTSFNANFARLPPGPHTIRVARAGSSDDSNAPLQVNAPPVPTITAPSIRGEQSLNYAAVELGRQWGPLEAIDIAATAGMTPPSYAGGSLSARPTNSDPGILFDTGSVAIDAARYRSLCYTFEVSGPRDVFGGSVSRILWGSDMTSLVTSEDIIIEPGTNEYCIRDLAAMPREVAPVGTWSGNVPFFRFDPHEFTPSAACTNSPSPVNCRDFRLDSMILSPFAQANPGYTVRFNVADADGPNATVQAFLDPDTNPANGNSILMGQVGGVAGNGQIAWVAPGTVTPGTYEVYLVASDSFNTVTRYAGGPLVVGAGSTTTLAVTAPATDTVRPPARDYGNAELGNRFDMDSPADLNLARTFNVDGKTIAGGKFSGTSGVTNGNTPNDPAIVLVHPGDAQPPVSTSLYRYLTAKIRLTGAGTQFLQVFYATDPNFTPGSFGFTQGRPIPTGSWQIVTIDLLAEKDPTAALAWNGAAAMSLLRLDPTNQAGVQIEIDWISLTGALDPASDFVAQWTASNLDGSTYQVALVDVDGAEWIAATGLAGTARNVTINAGRLNPASYRVRVRATPGPTALSAGNLVLIDGAAPGGAVLFANGFE